MSFVIVKERPRPEFEQEIKRRIRKLESQGQAEKAKQYRQFNPVYEVCSFYCGVCTEDYYVAL